MKRDADVSLGEVRAALAPGQVPVDGWSIVTPASSRKLRVGVVMKRIVGRAGGGEKVLCETANLFADAGARVTLYHADAPGWPFFPLRPTVDVVSVRPRRGPAPEAYGAPKGRPQGRAMWKFRFPLSVGLWWWQHGWHVLALRRFFRAHGPDVLIAFQPSATTDTLIAALGLGIPVVASLHNVPREDLYKWDRWDANPFDRFLRRLMLHRASRITVLLDEFVGQLAPGLRSRVVVMPNSIAVSGPLAQPAASGSGRRTIIAVGRLAAAKDHACLIDAWSSLHTRFPDWQVEIYGSGPLRKALQQRIAERGVGSSLFLRGETDRVMEAYARSHIFCMPSLFEGFGLVTAEALAKGLPAIGFLDCPGTNTLIEHEANGLLVDPAAFEGDRAAALAHGLERLMLDSGLRVRLGAAGPASMERFRPDAIRTKWIAVVNEIVPASLRLNPGPSSPD